MLGLANFGVALGKLEPDRLGQIGIETDTLFRTRHWSKRSVKIPCWRTRKSSPKLGMRQEPIKSVLSAITVGQNGMGVIAMTSGDSGVEMVEC